MSKLKIEAGDWVVVCDGAKALILENVGDAKFPNLHTREVREENHATTREMGADAPGRTFQSVGEARSSVEQTDWHDRAERDFLHGLAKSLDESARRREATRIHIVASPRALGELRQVYGTSLRDILGEEVAKDYAGMPVHEIERILTGGAPGTG